MGEEKKKKGKEGGKRSDGVHPARLDLGKEEGPILKGRGEKGKRARHVTFILFHSPERSGVRIS